MVKIELTKDEITMLWGMMESASVNIKNAEVASKLYNKLKQNSIEEKSA